MMRRERSPLRAAGLSVGSYRSNGQNSGECRIVPQILELHNDILERFQAYTDVNRLEIIADGIISLSVTRGTTWTCRNLFAAACECRDFLDRTSDTHFDYTFPFFSDPPAMKKALAFYRSGEALLALHFLFPVMDFTLGDLFQHLWAKQHPDYIGRIPEPSGLLAEFLVSTEFHSLGMDGLFDMLSGLLVDPKRLDLRNLVLHGFVPDQCALPTLVHYCALLYVLLVSIPAHRPELAAMAHRPLHPVPLLPGGIDFVLTAACLPSLVPLTAGARGDRRPRLADAALARCWDSALMIEPRRRCLERAYDLLMDGEAGASLLLLLPQLEAILRVLYVAANGLDRAHLCATPGTLYVIITTILAPVLLFPCTPYCVDLYERIQALTARVSAAGAAALARPPSVPSAIQGQAPPAAVPVPESRLNAQAIPSLPPAPAQPPSRKPTACLPLGPPTAALGDPTEAGGLNRLITERLSPSAVALLYDLFFHEDGLKLREVLHGRCYLTGDVGAATSSPQDADPLAQACALCWAVLFDALAVTGSLDEDASASPAPLRPPSQPRPRMPQTNRLGCFAFAPRCSPCAVVERAVSQLDAALNRLEADGVAWTASAAAIAATENSPTPAASATLMAASLPSPSPSPSPPSPDPSPVGVTTTGKIDIVTATDAAVPPTPVVQQPVPEGTTRSPPPATAPGRQSMKKAKPKPAAAVSSEHALACGCPSLEERLSRGRELTAGAFLILDLPVVASARLFPWRLVFSSFAHTVKAAVSQASDALAQACACTSTYGQGLLARVSARKAHTQQRRQFVSLSAHLPALVASLRLLVPTAANDAPLLPPTMCSGNADDITTDGHPPPVTAHAAAAAGISPRWSVDCRAALVRLWWLADRDAVPPAAVMDALQKRAMALPSWAVRLQRGAEEHHWCEVVTCAVKLVEESVRFGSMLEDPEMWRAGT